MKKNLLISLRLTLLMILLCGFLYPLIISGIGRLTPGGGEGRKERVNGKVVGYTNVGQKFTDDQYFWGRPSAVEYNASGSGGSNKGPSNPDYLQVVRDRIDTFLVHNPGVRKEEIPAELVTASGSGLDPHISPMAARVQVKRVATARKLDEQQVLALVNQHVDQPVPGPAVVNVLQLNIALDNLK